MSGNIPYAQPFSWDSPSLEESQQTAIRSLRKRKFVGSGLAVIREEALGQKSKMGKAAKNILMNLFHQHGIEIPDDGELETDSKKYKGVGMSESVRGELKSDSTDDEILRNAQEGKYSLFLSVLKAVEDTVGPVPTASILSKASLVLNPATLPGTMDAKDMVLAALHFLSSRYQTKSDDLLQLPLVSPLQAYGDLASRHYEKVGSWQLEDIRGKLLKLEDIFLTSPSSWKWLNREKFCPRLSKEDETSFFMTGSVPLIASAKKGKPESSKKRRVTSPSPSVLQSEAGSSIIAEASIEDIEGTSDDDDDSVIEATIVEEIS